MPTLHTLARLCMWTGNAAGAVMLAAAAATLYLADQPEKADLTMLCGGLWFLTGGTFLGLGRGLPMVLLGRVRAGGLLRVIAAATDAEEPVREGPMVRLRGAVFLMAGAVLGLGGLGLTIAALGALR